MTRNGQHSGRTLVELLMVLAIAASLLASSSGSLSELVLRERRFQAVLDLRRALNYARANAIILQTQVTLCAVDREMKCQREWAGRDLVIFIDSNRNRHLDEGEALHRQHWGDNRGSLTWRAALARPYIAFQPGGDTGQNGSFLFCPRGKSRASVVVVNRAGRNYVDESSTRKCYG